MRNAAVTREHIVRQAAALFNQRGFAGASMADIMAATGLQKGGIYGHFESKEALALEAFDYAVAQMAARFAAALQGRTRAVERIRAILGVYETIADDPPVPGGCPVMNAVVEADDGNPALRVRARAAMDGLQGLIRRNVRDGVARGELRADADAEGFASLAVATLEGAVVLSRLYGDGAHVRRAVRHLSDHVETSLAR
jgi:TetR/AcrR family transcriptional repressor of nem operon